LPAPSELPVTYEAPDPLSPDAHAPVIDIEYSSGRAPGYAALVTLRGEHDLTSSGELRATLDSIFGDVLVDLTRCDFMDSTVIAILLAKLHDLKREGRRLDLVAPSENAAIARVVDVVGMRELLTVREELPAAEETPGH
jgi:anti-anti-sigma factor